MRQDATRSDAFFVTPETPIPRRNAKALTDKGIERLAKAAPGQRKEMSDLHAPGLVLRITEHGRKSWSVYYRWRGTNTRFTLGPWPGIPVADARTRAQEVRDWVRRGVDPKLAIRGQDSPEAPVVTFGALAEEYIRRETPRLVQGRKDARAIERHLLPAWRGVPVDDLRRRDLIRITDRMLDAGSPAMACRVHELAKRVMIFGLNRGVLDLNPFSDMRAPAPTTPRSRVLKPAEIAALWGAWETQGYPYGAAQQLLLLTGQRRTEVSEMTWGEVDGDVWTIPAERSKSKREMLVPLSDMAVDILDNLPRFTDSDVVFRAVTGRPITGYSKAKARVDGLSGVNGWRIHDLRRTCRTGLARLGVAEIVAERCLNHAPKGLSGVYNVHEYQDEKAEAFQKWADELRTIIDPPANLVRLEAG